MFDLASDFLPYLFVLCDVPTTVTMTNTHDTLSDSDIPHYISLVVGVWTTAAAGRLFFDFLVKNH